jgi:hypothetical protein
MSYLKRLLRRSRADRRLLAQALVLHGAVVLLLRLVQYGRLCRWGSALAATVSRRGAGRADDEHRILWAVRTVTATLPLGRTCLSEALTAHWLLASAGCSSRIRFGVAPEPRAGFAAHAWIESNGRPLLDLPDSGIYLPLD